MNEEFLSAASAPSRSHSGPLSFCPGQTQLVQWMAEGHQDALSQLYDQTSPLINGLLLRMLDRTEDAEEVLLDVYMKAWKYAGAYREQRGSVQAWLVTMARNAAIDRIRQRSAQSKTRFFETDTTPEPVSAASSPEQQTAEALASYQNDEIAKWWPIIKAADIKLE